MYRIRIARLLGALALAVGLLFASAGAATAAPTPYPPPASGPTVVVNTGALQPGQSITLTFTGFTPNETITIIVYSDPVNLGSFTAGSDGAVTATVTLPTTLDQGAHTIVATGATSGRTPSLAFTVSSGLVFTGEGQGGGSGGGGGLAFTGIAVAGSLVVAIALLTAGTATLLAGRRKAL